MRGEGLSKFLHNFDALRCLSVIYVTICIKKLWFLCVSEIELASQCCHSDIEREHKSSSNTYC